MYKKNLFLLCLLFSIRVSAQDLNLLDFSSPEKTFQTFYSAMQDYSKGLAEQDENLQKRLLDAISCFESSVEDPPLSEKKETAILLKEIIDKSLEPGDFEIFNLRLKNTNIFFKKIDDWYYISKFSLNRAFLDYSEIQEKPYQHHFYPGAQKAPSWLEKMLPTEKIQPLLGLNYIKWLSLIFALVLALVLYSVCDYLLFIFHKVVFRKKELYYDIAQALRHPVSIFLAALFLEIFIKDLRLSGFSVFFWTSFTKILFAIATFWTLYCLVYPFEKALHRVASKTKSDLDDQLVPLLGKTAKVILILLAVLTTIQSLGVNVFSLIAGLGVGGLAIALAAKDTAANFFGSLMILFDQPFAQGDWVKINNLEGTVEEIGFRSTRIRTFYDSQVVIPNSTVASSDIDNLGRRQYRRTLEHLGLTYSTSKENLEKFIESLKKIIQDHPLTRKDKFHVAFDKFGESSLEILLYYFIETPDYAKELQAKQEILFQIKKLAEEIGVEFAYPSQSLYFENTLDVSRRT